MSFLKKNHNFATYTLYFTASGILTHEISSKTMESKLTKGLFFAGEVINPDAETGGYNLQIAYSTGWLAGEHS
ncbi:MAG: NAD(P)/FAD-dependent oxidoreductase, partial [Bacteroidales bacterium]